MKRRANSSPMDYAINLALAAVAGSSGCAIMVVVISAFLLGLLLDNFFGTRPIFTIILVVMSVPVSLWMMVQIALRAAKKIERRQYGKRDTISHPDHNREQL